MIEGDNTSPGPAARWFSGHSSPHLTRLMTANSVGLPEDYTVLERVERIAQRLERLHSGTGNLSDSLVVIRTQEAFSGGFVIPPEDLAVLAAALQAMDDASVNEVRSASLMRLDAIIEKNPIEDALARWVEKRLPEQPPVDALWILEQHLGGSHATWWRRAVRSGVEAGCRGNSRQWATALWEWWQTRSGSLRFTIGYIDGSSTAEAWLAASANECQR